MSKSKKFQPKNSQAQHLAAVPADGSPASTATEIRLWRALAYHAGATTAELADHAGIGTSTAGKILPRWQEAGHVTRALGRPRSGNRRAPGTWAIATQHDTTGSGAEMAAEPTRPGEAGNGTPNGRTSRPAAEGASTDIGDGQVPPTDGGDGKRKLRSGELRGMVEDFLREPERAGSDYTPGDVGRVLGRSSGAVYNCLRKLAANDVVEQTSDKPRRYRLTAAATDG